MVKAVLTDLDLNNNDILNSNLSGGSSSPNKFTSVGMTAPQSAPNTTLTTINWDTEGTDDGNWHDNVTNNSRITVDADGTYLVTSEVRYATNATGSREVFIARNGSVLIGQSAAPSTFGNTRVEVTTVVELVAGDYVEIQTRQDSGGPLNIELSSFKVLDVTGGGSGSGGATLQQAEVRRTTNQTIPTGVATALSWDTEAVDTGGFFDIGSPTDLTIPEDGLYFISASAVVEDNATGVRQMSIRRDGTAEYVQRFNAIDVGSSATFLTVAGTLNLLAGEVITITVFQDSGGNLNSEVSGPRPMAHIHKIDVGSGGGGTTTGAEVTSNVAQTLSDSTLTALTFDTEGYDTENYFDIGNPTRITIPEDGFYVLSSQTSYAANSTGARRAQFRVNGTNGIGAQFILAASATSDTQLNTTITREFSAGDYVELYGEQTSGGNLDVNFRRVRITKVPGGSGGGASTGARVTHSVNQTISTATPVDAAFDTEAYDDGAYHDTITNNERLTVPADGKYLIVGQAQWAGNATGERIINLRKNGSTSEAIVRTGTGTSAPFRHQITTLCDCVAGDYFTMNVNQTSGGNLDLESTNTFFSINAIPGGGSGGGREVLTANRTYYVATTGSDSNDGLTVGNPFLTIQKAVDTIASIDPLEYTVDVQLADGTYDGQTELKEHMAPSRVVIKGNNSDITAVVLTTTANEVANVSGVGSYWGFKDLTLSNSGGTSVNSYTLRVFNNANINLDTCRLLASGGNTRGVLIGENSTVTVTNSIDIEGTFSLFLWVVSLSSVVGMEGVTVNLVSSPSVGTYIFMKTCSSFDQNNITTNGSLTGTRYSLSGCCTIRTTGATDTDVPGNAAGLLASGSFLSN